jgi:hypothetical protein
VCDAGAPPQGLCLPFEHWGINQPNSAGEQDCLSIAVVDEQPPEVLRSDWTDDGCAERHGVLCDATPSNVPLDCVAFDAVRPRVACVTHATWQEARSRCEVLGGKLAKIESGVEHAAVAATLVGIFSGSGETDVWLGATDADIEGEWRWLDGARLFAPFSDWGNGEPNDVEGAEDCLELFTIDGRWNDNVCDIQHGYICRLPPGGDDSGCVRAGELAACPQPRSFEAAQADCEARGGLLARIDTPAENAAALDLMLDVGQGALWLGGTDAAQEGRWRWTDGTLFDVLP